MESGVMPPCEIQDLKRIPFKTYRNRLQTAKNGSCQKGKCFQRKSYGVNLQAKKSPFQNSLVSSEMGFSLLVNFGLKVEGCQSWVSCVWTHPLSAVHCRLCSSLSVPLGYGNSIRISPMLVPCHVLGSSVSVKSTYSPSLSGITCLFRFSTGLLSMTVFP